MLFPLRECVLEFARLDENDQQAGVPKTLAIEEFERIDGLNDEEQTPQAIMDPRRIIFHKLAEWLKEQLDFNSAVDVILYSLPGQAWGDNEGKSSTRVIDSDISLRGAVQVLRNVERPVLNMSIMRGEKENIVEAEELHFNGWKKEVGKIGQEQTI